jgi:hypothetical protein
MFVGLIVLIVLVTLCAILGAIYSYIYYTRISPTRARKHEQVQNYGTNDDDTVQGPQTTHIFMFRKNNNNN